MKNQYYIAVAILVSVASLVFQGIYSVISTRFTPERDKAQLVIKEAERRDQQLTQLQQGLREHKVTVVAYEQYQTIWEKRLSTYSSSQQISNRLRDLAERAFNLHVTKLKAGEQVEIAGRTASLLELEVVGNFPDIMAWLSQVETDIDFLRHAKGSWRPQAQGRLALAISFAVDYNLLNASLGRPKTPDRPKIPERPRATEAQRAKDMKINEMRSKEFQGQTGGKK